MSSDKRRCVYLRDLFALLTEEGTGLCRRFLQVKIQRCLLMAGGVLFAPQHQHQTQLCGKNRLGTVHLGMTARAKRDHQSQDRLPRHPVMHDHLAFAFTRSVAVPAG